MKTIAIFAIAAAMTAATAPALARQEGRVGEGKVSYNQKTGKYCVRVADPSRILPHTICRTADKWADAGLTISRKPAAQLAQR